MIFQKFMILKGTRFNIREDGLAKLVANVHLSPERESILRNVVDYHFADDGGDGDKQTNIYTTFRVRVKTSEGKLRGIRLPWGSLHARVKGTKPFVANFYNVLKKDYCDPLEDRH